MPRVTIPGVGDMMFPDSMSDQEIMTRAKAIQSQYAIPETQFDPRDLPASELIKGGFNRGIESLKGTAFDLVPALGASIFGKDEYAKQQLEEYKARMEAAEEKYPTAYKKLSDIESPTDVFKFGVETFGELGPDIASFMLGTGVGTTAGKIVAKKGLEKAVEKQAAEYAARKGLTKEAEAEYASRLLTRAKAGEAGQRATELGADIGLKTGLWGTSAGLNVPDTFNQIYQDTGKIEPVLALGIGSMVSALDTYLPGKILKQLSPGAKERLATEMLSKSDLVPTTWKRAFAAAALKTASGEALTEGGQQVLQIVGSQIAGDTKGFFSQENIDSILMSAVKGFVGGGTYGTPGAMVEAKQIKDERNRQIGERKAFSAAAQNALRQQAQTGPLLGFTPPPGGYQPDLFPTEKARAEAEAQAAQARAEAAAQAYRPEFDLGQKMEVAPAVEPVAPQQMELPLFEQQQAELDLTGARTPEQMAIEQRVAAENAAQVQAIKDRAATAKQLLDEEIALTDERVRTGEINRRQAARLDLLHPILENPAIANTVEAFKANLRRAGYANLELTDVEKSLIQRADDVKAALAEAEKPEVEPAAPSELGPEVTGIKEKAEKGPAGEPKPKEVEPKQLTLEGIPTPRQAQIARAQAEQAAEEGRPEAVVPQQTVLDEVLLGRTGLSRMSGYYKQLLNKDMAKPEDQAVVAQILRDVRANPNLAESTKQAIESVAMQAFNALATQAEMFGPRGGILAKGAPRGRAPIEAVGERGGAGVSVPSKQKPRAAKRAGAPESGRVEAAEKPAARPRVGEAAKPAPLTDEDIAEIEAEAAAELAGEVPPKSVPRATKRVAERTAERVAKKRTKPAAKAAAAKEPEAPVPTAIAEAVKESAERAKTTEEGVEIGEFLGKDYTSFAKEDISDIDDNIKVTNLIRGIGKADPETRAARLYFMKMPRIVDNLINIAFDVANDTPQFRVADETTAEAKFFQGMNGNNARLAMKWVTTNLSGESENQLRQYVRGFERARDAYTDAEFMRLIMEGFSGKSETEMDETVSDYIRSTEAERAAKFAEATNRKEKRAALGISEQAPIKKMGAVSRLGMSLHPAIVSALKEGDLSTALKLLSASTDAFVSRIANRLAGLNLETKVVVKDNLKDTDGMPVPGYFDPKTNTIYLDSETGMNSHVLLHEPTHAGTSHVLDNPNHPLTKQLQKLLDKIRDSLDTAYGATNVNEFAAEVQSNPEFVNKLKSIFPDNGKTSAWDQFVRIVGNFLRRLVGLPPKGMESAYDQADRIIAAILSKGPEYRSGGNLYAQSMNQSNDVFKRIDKVINAVPVFNNKQKDVLSEAIRRTGGIAQSAIKAVLPTHALSEMAESVFPGMARNFHILINERSGYQNKLTQGIDAVVQEAKSAIAAKPEQRDEFNTIVNTSTVEEVDPTKPVSEYTDPEQIKVWNNLNARYKRLDPVWQKLYVTMRDGYKGMYEEVKKAIESRINDADISDETKVTLKRDIMDRLAKKGMIDPYFGLGREGEYWLAADYKDKSGQQQTTIEAFKTHNERERRIEELSAQGATRIDKFANIAEVNYRRAAPGSFVNSVLRIMDVNKVPSNVTDEIMRLFLTTLPETAFAQSFQKRKNTPGYMEDTIGVFERKMRNTSHQVANMRYNPKISNVVDQMRDHTRMVGMGTDTTPARDNALEASYLEEFEKHMKYVLNPTKNDIGSILTSAAFTYTLGFNLSSALVNFANIPMVVAPYLKGRYGDADIREALGEATRAFLNSGTKTRVPVLGADGRTTEMPVRQSIANYAPDSAMGKKYATLVEIANQQGQLNRSQLYEIIRGDTRTGVLDKFNAMSGWMFHHGERMNREVSMVAAYNLELARLKKQGKTGREAEVAAANHAIYVSELTNGSISAATAPRIAQNSLGKVLFMYKRYGVSMYYMLFKTAKEALKGQDQATRDMARRQLGGIVGMSALLAGAQGIPMFGLASLIWSLFSDDDDEDLDTVTQKALGDLLYKGPVEYFTNLAIASRISLSDLIVRDAPANTASTFSQQMAQAFGGPVFGVSDRIQRGLNKISEGHIERGVEDLMPSAIGNGFKAIRYALEGTTTLRGDPITGDVSAWNVFAQAFGFAPADYTRQLEINSREKGVDKFVNQKASKLKQRYYLANRMGDDEGKEEAKDELLKLGEKHPGLEINVATISDVLERSMAAQDRATKEMVHGVRYSKRMRAEAEASMKEYEGQ